MSDVLLALSGLTTGYAGVPVVRDIELVVRAGEVVVLFGPNGAGKSTTLLASSGLLPVMGGRIDLLGAPVDPSRPHHHARRGLAHVPEDRGLFSDLTVAENLRLGVRGAERRTRTTVLARAAELFPRLAALQGQRAGLLSGGEQQMLAMARAIVSEPRLLLVDEMSLGLAPLLVEELLPVMRTIADEHGTGVLLVEQHVHMALAVADRGYLLNHGRVVLDGAAASLAARPDLLAATYLGDTAL